VVILSESLSLVFFLFFFVLGVKQQLYKKIVAVVKYDVAMKGGDKCLEYPTATHSLTGYILNLFFFSDSELCCYFFMH